MKLREELDAACNGPRGWVSAKFVSAAYVLMDKADGIIAEREETIRQLRAQLAELTELIEYCKAMKEDAERYRVIRNWHNNEVDAAVVRAKEPIYGSRLDEIVDAAMGGGDERIA